ncbi:Nicotinamidase-related amidase [Desulfotomaculum arcticum]|uniref:Nicotinamidase-related amidase n=1 Tax=Desulfotruncus arcticus DSM 17038 TaxID=1121424 RepID=A0A1I2UXH2_9FIRM|nr:isochorismatase family cysteine hydrolase [Desulfotruncus arcticus]SFG81834.1 Nicotinamidase-related amidase [Desulfotomaculum arcticum] [Desulfotruncus arcticus DSM 17038]
MSKKAVIVVDMLNDFVTGCLKCERSSRIIAPLKKLIETARARGVPVIYSNDAHYKGMDKELEHWGDHAIAGTAGAEVIEELKPEPGDYIVPKRRYSGFFQTDLQLILTELGVDTLIITGLHCHMCVRHTTADAFQWGYKIIVPSDATDAFTEEDYQMGMKYLVDVYGADIKNVDEILESL